MHTAVRYLASFVESDRQIANIHTSSVMIYSDVAADDMQHCVLIYTTHVVYKKDSLLAKKVLKILTNNENFNQQS